MSIKLNPCALCGNQHPCVVVGVAIKSKKALERTISTPPNLPLTEDDWQDRFEPVPLYAVVCSGVKYLGGWACQAITEWRDVERDACEEWNTINPKEEAT